MSFSKHDVWEMSRDISAYLAGDLRFEESAQSAISRQNLLSEEDKAEMTVYADQIREEVNVLRAQLTSTVDDIFLLEELPESIVQWREADLMKYIGAAQQYEIHELLISAILTAPNVALLFDFVEPAYDQ